MRKMKRCSKCRQMKDIDKFSPLKTARDGVQSQCRECHKKCNKKWYKKNRDELIKKMLEAYYEKKRKKNEQVQCREGQAGS